jgi:hypothetical protein
MAIADITLDIHQPGEDAERILDELQRRLHDRFSDQYIALARGDEGRRVVGVLGISGQENTQLVRDWLDDIDPQWNEYMWLD